MYFCAGDQCFSLCTQSKTYWHILLFHTSRWCCYPSAEELQHTCMEWAWVCELAGFPRNTKSPRIVYDTMAVLRHYIIFVTIYLFRYFLYVILCTLCCYISILKTWKTEREALGFLTWALFLKFTERILSMLSDPRSSCRNQINTQALLWK